jgi:hypothetical protein
MPDFSHTFVLFDPKRELSLHVTLADGRAAVVVFSSRKTAEAFLRAKEAEGDPDLAGMEVTPIDFPELCQLLRWHLNHDTATLVVFDPEGDRGQGTSIEQFLSKLAYGADAWRKRN